MDLKGHKITQREKILLILVGVTALACLFYFFIYQSQIQEMASIRSQITANANTLNELKGFTQQLANTEREVDQLDEQIYDATLKWFPNLKQDVIIKDLEQKLASTQILEGSVSFSSSKTAQIGTATKEEAMQIADALALSFVTLMQKPLPGEEAQQQQSLEEKAGELINTVSDTLAIATPTPGPDNDEKTTAFGAQAGAGKSDRPKATEAMTVDMTEKLEELKQSFNNLTDAELKAELESILASTEANVEKMVISVNFTNASYTSVMDFIKKVENTSPNIYVESLSLTDSTGGYVSLLQDAESHAEEERVDALNLIRVEKNLPVLAPNEITVQYTGSDKYSGSLTLAYFAVSKIHRDAA